MSTYQVRSLEEADLIIKQHERKTKTSYALLRSTKNFGCIDVPACSNEEYEVRFDTVGVPYCGVPFFVAGLKILQCQSFKEKTSRNVVKKKEIKIELTGSGAGVIGGTSSGVAGGSDELLDATVAAAAGVTKHGSSRKRKKPAGGRMPRVSCTATIIMKEVIYYPEFQLFEHSKNNRVGVARQLKEVLRSKASLQKDRIIYVTVPANSDHFGHPVGLVVNMKVPSKRIYVKNDYYGPVDNSSDGSSAAKRLYFPIKQEKETVAPRSSSTSADTILGLLPSSHLCYNSTILSADSYQSNSTTSNPSNGSNLTSNTSAGRATTNNIKKEDDTDVKAKEVREVLQSIMAFTYKAGNLEAFHELYGDLINAKQRYINAIEIHNHKSSQPQQLQRQQQRRQQQPPPQQQIVFVKQAKAAAAPQQQQQLAPRQPSQQRPLQAKTQQQQVLQVQSLEPDQSTLSITINALPGALSAMPAASVGPLSGGGVAPINVSPLSTISSLPTVSLASIPASAMSAIPVASLPTVTIAANSLAAIHNSSLPITTIPSFSTVVVPSGLQPSSVTLTIPAASLSSLASFPAASLSPLPNRSLTSASAGTASISISSLAAIQTNALSSIHAAALPSLQGNSLSSIVAAASISPLQSDAIVSTGSSTHSVANSLTNNSLPTVTVASISSLPIVSISGTPVHSLASGARGSVASVRTSNISSSNLPGNTCIINSIPTAAGIVANAALVGGGGSSNVAIGLSTSRQNISILPAGTIISPNCLSAGDLGTSIGGTVNNTHSHLISLASGQQSQAITSEAAASTVAVSLRSAGSASDNNNANKHNQQQQLLQQHQVNNSTSNNCQTALNASAATTASAATSSNLSVESGLVRGSSSSATATAATVAATSSSAAAATDGSSSQETSIFIEAMEAILNSHV